MTIFITVRKQRFFLFKFVLKNEILEYFLKIVWLEDNFNFFKAVFRLAWLNLLMIESNNFVLEKCFDLFFFILVLRSVGLYLFMLESSLFIWSCLKMKFWKTTSNPYYSDWTAGRRAAGESGNKTNSVQFQLNCLLELSLAKKHQQVDLDSIIKLYL